MILIRSVLHLKFLVKIPNLFSILIPIFTYFSNTFINDRDKIVDNYKLNLLKIKIGLKQ